MEAISFFDRGLAKAPFKKAPLINTLISLKLGVHESYIHGVFEANTKKKKRKEKKKKPEQGKIAGRYVLKVPE